jgi:NAD(P)H-hydrate epimerase
MIGTSLRSGAAAPAGDWQDALQKVASGAEMQKLDARAIEAGVPGLVLMENAARGAVDVLVQELGLPGRAWVVCGKGNNGGDGLAMARHLHNRGSSVEVLLLAEPQALQGDAAANLGMARALGLPLVSAVEPEAAVEWLGRSPAPDVLVDAIFGTGLTSAPRGLAAAAIEAISGRPELCVFAVDLPSGLSAESGAVPGAAVAARVTATFGLLKLPHVLYPAAARCGRVRVVEISLPRRLLDEAPAACWTGVPPCGWLPPRPADTHKGTYGRLLVVAGSPGMSGAAVLAARAAVRGGAGLVTVASSAATLPAIVAQAAEPLSLALPADPDEGLAPESVRLILRHLEAAGSALLLGPGLGSAPSTVEAVTRLVERVPACLVLDADGLNCLARAGDPAVRLAARPAPTILTPHPGEMARLLGRRVAERLADAAGFAAASRSVVLLKGAGTVVTDGAMSYVNPTGNPGMATGGSGDVLGGLLGALVAQGLPGLRAAVLAAYLHGLAGDLAAVELGQEALAAGDLVDFLPAAWKRWRAGP